MYARGSVRGRGGGDWYALLVGILPSPWPGKVSWLVGCVKYCCGSGTVVFTEDIKEYPGKYSYRVCME